VPMGTGNLLARNVDLPMEGTRALIHTALTGVDHPMDVGWIRPRALLAAEEAEHTGQVGHTEAEEVRAASGPDRHSDASGTGTDADEAGPDGGRPGAGADDEAPDPAGGSDQGRTADDGGPAGSAQKQP